MYLAKRFFVAFLVCVQQLANAMGLDWALVQFLGWFQYLRWTACHKKAFSPGAWSLLADGLKLHNLPPEASARASLQKLWEATGAELLFAARLTGQQTQAARPRPDFSVYLRWQLPKPFPAVTFDDMPLLLHPTLQHLLRDTGSFKCTSNRLPPACAAPHASRPTCTWKGSQRGAFFYWFVRSGSSGRYGFR